MNRCRHPLCVKLENPELSRKECDHTLYCFLLHSKQVCLRVCVRPRVRVCVSGGGGNGETKVNEMRKQGNKSKSESGEKSQLGCTVRILLT